MLGGGGLNSDELRNLYSLPDIIITRKSRRMRNMGHVAHLTVMKNLFSVVVEDLTPFALPGCRLGDNIKMNIVEMFNVCLAVIRVVDDRFECGLTTSFQKTLYMYIH